MDTTTDTAKAIGIAGAAQAFESLLTDTPVDTEPPKQAEVPKAPPAEEAEVTVEAESNGDETTTAEEAEAAPEEEAPVSEGEPEAAQPETKLYTVKIDGKEEQVSLDEALKGYQRLQDYSRKTDALGKARREFETERQAVTQERAQYAQMLTALQTQLQNLQPSEPNWDELYRSDPLEYVRQKDLYRERQEKLAAVNFEAQRLQSIQAQEQQAALGKLVEENRAKMLEAMPSWKDSKKWETDRTKILQYGKGLGFTEEELNSTYDHRAVMALYKAMQYDNLMSNKPQPVAPKGPKTVAAGSAASTPKSTNEVTRARQRLAKTGKVADAAALMEAFLE